MTTIVLIAHNLRSCHNVGSLLRTAEGLGVSKVWLTGYTPYPAAPDDERLPHLAAKISKQINKTSLGAEDLLPWQHAADVSKVIADLKSDGFAICAIEQHASSIPLPEFEPPAKIALIIGREVEGIEEEVLNSCDMVVEIPMSGKKESFNVVQAAAMVLYRTRFS